MCVSGGDLNLCMAYQVLYFIGRFGWARWRGRSREWAAPYGLVQFFAIGAEEVSVGFVIPGIVLGEAVRPEDFVGDHGSGIRFGDRSRAFGRKVESAVLQREEFDHRTIADAASAYPWD